MYSIVSNDNNSNNSCTYTKGRDAIFEGIVAKVVALFEIYHKGFAFSPWVKEPRNLDMLEWGASQVYYNQADDIGDVKRMATEREPVNIAMTQHYDKRKLRALAGYDEGAYGYRESRSSYRLGEEDYGLKVELMPNIAIYCVTPVIAGRRRLDRVHVINLVGYAFDHPTQPDNRFFGGKDAELLKIAYAKVWAYALAAARDHGLTTIQAFGVGMGAFRPQDVSEAEFRSSYVDGAIQEARGIVWGVKDIQVCHDANFRIPDSLFEVKPEKLASTLYVNAWDPWSMVGNGNAKDASLDGFWGRSTAMAPLCWPITNPAISYKPVIISPHHNPLSQWVFHVTDDGQTFYRRGRNDSSLTRHAPKEGVREVKYAVPNRRKWNAQTLDILRQKEEKIASEQL